MGNEDETERRHEAVPPCAIRHIHDVKPQDDSMRASQAGQAFDVDRFLAGLDAIFDAHKAATDAEPYLQQALIDAENAGDDAGLLTVLNETMGFYRSQGRHEDNQWIIQRALELGLRMGLEGSEAWTTTLINAATGMRAAGRYDQAEELYQQALDSARTTIPATDRRMAALHNNLSMLYSETGRATQAQQELETALAILDATSVDTDADLDVASTHTNLALVMLQRVGVTTASDGNDDHERRRHLLDEAHDHAKKALDIYRTGHLEHSAHYASALAGYAQVCYAEKDFEESVTAYRHALDVIEECYGKNTDYYRTTAQNLHDAEHALRTLPDVSPIRRHVPKATSTTPPSVSDSRDATETSRGPVDATPGGAGPSTTISGLKLARAYWERYGKPLVDTRYGEFRSRIAAGLVGHGSECYGFDDAWSHDHDFGPGFCLWLTDEDYRKIGPQLQADYDALPDTFMGFGPRASTTRAQNAGRRVGVFSIGDFFAGITGYRRAPAADKPHEWLMLDEPTLAAATNGEVFADPLGTLLSTRQGFTFMPEDVRLSLISRRLGMIAQAGQYNLPRMLKRNDGAAAWRSINEFVNAVVSLVFLINSPVSVGYMPYYKWQFAALRRLSSRIATRLSDVCGQLEDILRLSSTACFAGAGFAEGGKGDTPARLRIASVIDHICEEIVEELHRERLSDANETFLEWQRPYVEEHIASDDPALHSL